MCYLSVTVLDVAEVVMLRLSECTVLSATLDVSMYGVSGRRLSAERTGSRCVAISACSIAASIDVCGSEYVDVVKAP